MARSAVLSGRVLADTVYMAYTATLLILIGFVIGFRFQGSLGEAALGFLLAVLFGFSLLWISILIGLSVKNVETAQLAGFIWLFPLTFASSAFVPVETLPSGLAEFAKWNPVTIFVDAVRGLWLGPVDYRSIGLSIAWAVVLTSIFAPLGVWRYRRG